MRAGIRWGNVVDKVLKDNRGKPRRHAAVLLSMKKFGEGGKDRNKQKYREKKKGKAGAKK